MLNRLYRLFLAINATSWVVVLFGIKEDWTVGIFPSWIFNGVLLLIPILLSFVSILLTVLLGKDNLNQCSDIEEVSNSFLPIYLGYFFVGLGVEKWQHLAYVYLIIVIFTYVAQTQYFNPIFLLFGFRFYNVTTNIGTKILLISRKPIRRAEELSFPQLQRINDTTFISLGGKE
jgi:hypothetical protein